MDPPWLVDLVQGFERLFHMWAPSLTTYGALQRRGSAAQDGRMDVDDIDWQNSMERVVSYPRIVF